MKYIKLFEKFTKEYQTKIDVKDFKKIKKGSKIQYMGGPVEVLDNSGYVLKLKGEDGRTFTVNKSQFDHGGRISEVNDGKKKKKKKEFHPDMMYEAKGKKVINDLYKMDAQIDYLSDADDATKKIWQKAGVNPNDDNQIILYSYVNSWPETKKLLDKARIKYKELEDPNSAGESFIVFNVNESVNELRSSPVSGTKAGFTQSLEDRKYELKKDAKGATIGSFSNVTLPKGTIIYNLPGGVFADHFSLKNKYASRSSQGPQYFDKPTFKGIMIKQTPAVLSYIEKNSKVLESVVNEAKAYKLKASEFGGDTHSAAYNVKGEPTWRVHSTYAIDQVSGNNNPEERDVVFFEAMPINKDIYIKIGGINNLKRSNGSTYGNNFSTTIEEWKKDPKGIAKEASKFLTDATHLKWLNKKAKSEGQTIKWALKDDYSSVIEDLVNKSLGLKESVNEAEKPYKKGQRVDYQLNHKGGVGKFADAMSKSKNIESGVIKKRTKGFAGTFKYELTNGLELYGSEIVGLTEGTYNSVINELSSAQDGTKDSDGKHKHEHHIEEDIEAMWKKAYGENFSSQYPAVAKIIKQRKIKDKREIARIWQDTYDEDFEKEYPALYQKLS